MNKSLILRLFLLALVAAPASLLAQAPGGELPQLEIEPVRVLGKRTVVLPKARKGEVLDTSVYTLPPGDTMLTGQRISNLAGNAGPLPGFREFELPLKLDAEASIGSYVSPRGLINAEYIRPTFDIAGMLDYQSTAGHIDSAEASSLLVGVRGSLVVGDRDVPPLKTFRVTAAADHAGDSYFLYGNTATPYDRSRTSNRLELGIRSEEELPVSYAIGFRLMGTSVEDRRDTSRAEATATAPAFDLRLGIPIDSTLRGRLALDFTTTSLAYGAPAQTPSYLSARGDLEWRPAPGTYVTAGVVIANGQNSDSGSSSLVMPRAAVRYALRENLWLFASYAPELRAATYREMIMRAPYVDRAITLHPERVPIDLSAGIAFNTDAVQLEGHGFFRSADNTPVVAADSIPGHLAYRHVDSRAVGFAASASVRATDQLVVTGEATFQSAVVRADGDPLPMTPWVDIRGRASFALNQEIDIFGSLQFQTEQRTVLSDMLLPSEMRTISPRFLLGAGASYRVVRNVQAFAEISNLLNYKYDLWQNYSAPGIEVRGGVRVTY
jgi:outer membrane receptor protein involved in Fe transport